MKNEEIAKDASVLKYEATKDYKLGRMLGRGAFAEVRLGTKLTNKEVRAVKVVDVKALSSTDVDALDLEIKTMRRLDHHNIVKLYEIYSYADKFVMVLELCKGGELFDRIVSKEHYSEREARITFAQMVEAIGHCHSKGVVHRDLKPENLLYQDKPGTPNAEVVKLADFGLASLLQNQQALNTACGTPGYVSPEILTASKTGGYGSECDLWSLGVILFILLCGYPPFYDENNNNAVIFKQIKTGTYAFADPYWTNVSEEAKSLIRRLLTVDPTKRIKCEEVFEHPWMKKDDEATNLHLPYFTDTLKKYNLRRKFKGVIHTMIVAKRLSTTGSAETTAAAEEALKSMGGTPAVAASK